MNKSPVSRALAAAAMAGALALPLAATASAAPSACGSVVSAGEVGELSASCARVARAVDMGQGLVVPLADQDVVVTLSALRVGAEGETVQAVRSGDGLAVKREGQPAVGRSKAARHTLDSTTADPAPSGNAASAARGCGSASSYVKTGWRVPAGGYNYLYNSTGQPDSGALASIQKGFEFMVADSSPCGTRATNAVTTYRGTTTLRYFASSDNHNVIGWGTFGTTNILAMSYTYSVSGKVVEADIAFNMKMPWTTSFAGTIASGRYDVMGVAAHEVGHVFGLDHTPADRAQVMYPSFAAGENRRTKGLGDLYGMNAVS